MWRDSESGWNLHVTTERFRFAPEHVGDTAWAIDGGMVRDGASITGTGGEHDTGHQHGHG